MIIPILNKIINDDFEKSKSKSKLIIKKQNKFKNVQNRLKMGKSFESNDKKIITLPECLVEEEQDKRNEIIIRGDSSIKEISSIQLKDEISTITSTSTSTSFSAKSTMYLQSFPSNFPIQTIKPIIKNENNKGYLFLKNSQVIDSMLIFITIFTSCLILTIIFLKINSIFFKNKKENKGKIDNVIMEEMKWAEGREVIERKIIYENNNNNDENSLNERSKIKISERGGRKKKL
ncbi:uncharacterized protein I206_105684 [Kwoniella pini CBS 10737]|uniref:Uncharacterized protein n=1 Tax=Kwoniella pini CBS 10737 TaxID=1296096 RepID=A0A1B9I3I8_9TREE|nr:uncharacterized protein I206_03414 [Kwoniella pini CBS 10737]OCF50097.1 hypothetical protein I206_03414 [Kwoniella pini CBS 10737]